MNFLKRLSKYLVGVMIGLGLTWIMFSERGCMDWLPSNRISKEIAMAGIMADSGALCVLKCGHLTVSDLADLARLGDVVYDKSGPREKPRRYFIESDGVVKSATYLITDTASVVTSIVLRDVKNCPCP
jgi:hypothetical protein|tara:strand:- start:284 stop:667 length:384 start_codon:yes stop_codon:yes gene_type:complete